MVHRTSVRQGWKAALVAAVALLLPYAAHAQAPAAEGPGAQTPATQLPAAQASTTEIPAAQAPVDAPAIGFPHISDHTGNAGLSAAASPAPLEAPTPLPAYRPADAQAPGAADEIADIFSKLGDEIYEDCIFELSDEQIHIRTALTQSYMDQGAAAPMARKLAAAQIQPPKLSEKCEQMRRMPPPPPPPSDWATTTEPIPQKPAAVAAARPQQPQKPEPPTVIALDGMTMPAAWDCADGVDFVTITLNGYKRKLTGGEICNPFEDVVRELPLAASAFRLGYTIRTGRLFVISQDPALNGQTIAWGLSGRDVCRNNPDPDCFATRAVGPLPPGEYAFAAEKKYRVTWGPKTKRHVAAVYLKKLWNKDRFSKAHMAAIMKRGNIAIHARLKGEMSEACIGLEPKGWAYVASLIRDGRATALNVYIDEPHPQIAEAPPVIVASTFSLTSLFK